MIPLRCKSGINKKTCRQLRDNMEYAIQQIERSTDTVIKITIGNMRFDTSSIQWKMKLTSASVDDDVEQVEFDKEIKKWNAKNFCNESGFQSTDLNKSIDITNIKKGNTKHYKLVDSIVGPTKIHAFYNVFRPVRNSSILLM